MNVIGHREIIDRLLGACRRGVSLPSMLFHGPVGVGKATTALYIAGMCNPESQRKSIFHLTHPDVLVVSYKEPVPGGPRPDDFDRTKTISIDAVRRIREEVGKPPVEAERRFIIFMDADMMTREAQNAFLKVLEEHDDRTTFLLVASNYYRLLPTIRSRVIPVAFGGLSMEEFLAYDHGWKHDPERLYNLSRGSIGLALMLDNKPLDLWARYLAEILESPSVKLVSAIYSTMENARDLLLFLIPFRVAVMKKYAKTGKPVYRYLFEDSREIEDMIFRHSSTEVLVHLLFKALFEFEPAV